MTRWRLDIEYDGRPFVGWQRQDNGPSVQAALERAVAGFCGEAVTATAAGRTDAGVHALHQVVHLDIDRQATPDTVRDALNHHLKPDPVAVLAARPVADDFSARFDAVERQYVYRILDRRPPATMLRGLVWHVPFPVDAGAMHAAGQALVGHHDFTTFRDAQCQARSPVKTVDELRVSRIGGEVEVFVRARSFLHHQVRSFVGTLVEVGRGKWPPPRVRKALEACDRAACGPVAPPDGLYLAKVVYPDEG